MMGYTWTLVVLFLGATYLHFREDFDPEALRNQRVLVTGASSGIGEQLAYQFCRLGARLVITARRHKELLKIAHQCKSLGAAQVEVVAADVKEAEDRIRVVKAAEDRLGGLDYLVLNPATLKSSWWLGNPENKSILQQDMEVNFASFVDFASRAMPLLVASRGRLGIVSSGCATMACPLFSHYAASKFALHGFFSSWRQELNVRGSGVSITMAVLGLIDTENTIQGRRMAAPADECAMAIVKGVSSRTTEMYYPRFAYYLDLMHRMFPDFVESYNAENMMQ